MDIIGLDAALMYGGQFQFLGPAHKSFPGKNGLSGSRFSVMKGTFLYFTLPR